MESSWGCCYDCTAVEMMVDWRRWRISQGAASALCCAHVYYDGRLVQRSHFARAKRTNRSHVDVCLAENAGRGAGSLHARKNRACL
jgi:hypothetical protein